VVEPLTVVAVALLVAGVVGSVVPGVPGPLLSLAGVFLHWWATGYAEPGLVALVGLTLVGLFALAVDLLAGALSTRASGASWWVSAAAGVAGVVLFFVAGPVGVAVGVAGTVFVLTFATGRDAGESARAALYATVGVLGSALIQALLALSMLVAFLLVLLL
jgi:uncharacterized protein YqgC (DUF456 family)